MKQGTHRAGLVLALVGVLVMAVAGIASGAIKTKTLSSGTVNTPITDFDTFAQEFQFKKKGKVRDVNVSVRATHEAVGDLLLAVVSPRGKIAQLTGDNGGSGDDLGSGSASCGGTPTRFDDEASALWGEITPGDAPFDASYRPVSPLSELDGSKTKGIWRLYVTDEYAADEGVLHCAELEITYKKKKKRQN